MSKYPFKMKATISTAVLSVSTTLSFISSYFFDLTLNNAEQYLAVSCVVLLDGLFGIMAGIKREGFKTYKALKILRTLFIWWLILTVTLSVEVGFQGTSWMSETFIIPFILFQLISALKNASLVGLIDIHLLNIILDKIDRHKGVRVEDTKKAATKKVVKKKTKAKK